MQNYRDFAFDEAVGYVLAKLEEEVREKAKDKDNDKEVKQGLTMSEFQQLSALADKSKQRTLEKARLKNLSG